MNSVSDIDTPAAVVDIRRMQANIAAHARKFQMSREDDPGDAVHMILQGAMRASQAIATTSIGLDRDLQ